MAARRRGAAVGARGRGGEARLIDAVRTSGLTKRYGDLVVVDALRLAIERGTLYGFLGPNGAGKTTTIRMLLGLVHPTAGEVEVLGEPLRSHADARRPLLRVGAMVEEPAFWSYLSGRRNLEYLARAAGPRDDARRRLARVDEVLATVGLERAAGKRVKAFSQGMRQRLGIAAALLGAPELLVLDEPTNGLDPQGMREIRTVLRRLADGGTTVFVSSHLLGEVESMCDRVGVLAHGRLVADGAPSELRTARDAVRVETPDPAAAAAALAGLPGADASVLAERTLRVALRDGLTPARVNAELVRAGMDVDALVPERATLEEVFLSLVGDDDVPR